MKKTLLLIIVSTLLIGSWVHGETVGYTGRNTGLMILQAWSSAANARAVVGWSPTVHASWDLGAFDQMGGGPISITT